ncbi:uncharacterized protein VICG_00059 [Vittaforma corneae ATCC 50505]|uniref:C2H2-type domain-containing protein n=1 Tax=Vittaforma corneae (strain ATCC 50505) TaxID=993615 RepID=L2GQ58_VITCO|nr:uncharacterized protein VICG_00059 [Vittaforma corneae ATCC 50505]ELA42744.1 hypothetical protein VICG_00059 [Vittaforma corneae ATCC 50505]
MFYSHKPGKRRYYENEIVDLPFLLNAPRILTENEFKRKLPDASYSQYFDYFLKRKTLDIFLKYSNAQWFKDRYLNDSVEYSSPKDIQNFTQKQASKFIQIKNISGHVPLSEVVAKVKSIIPTSEILVSQNGSENNFTRNMFVVGNGFGQELAIDNLRALFDVDIADISGKEVTNFSMANLDQAQRIFEELLKYENKDCITENLANEVRSKKDIDTYAKVLREDFYFCIDCCKKFDNWVDMVLSCSKHSQNDFCSRKFDILGHPKNIYLIKQSTESFERYYSKTQEKNYMCNQCEKTFLSVEFVTNHLRNKHKDIVSRIMESNSKLFRFLDRIDFFMFEMIFGTDQKSVPYYGICNVREGAVVYDIPCVFSGEIKFD